LVRGQRRKLHRKAAQWFEDSDLVLHAEHLAQAGDESAPGAFLDAAREQAGQYRLEKALALVRRGLEVTAKKESFALQCLQCELLRSLGLIKESIAVCRKAKKTGVSDIDRCRASVGLAEGLRIVEVHDELLEELNFVEAIATEHDLSLELARVYQLRAPDTALPRRAPRISHVHLLPLIACRALRPRGRRKPLPIVVALDIVFWDFKTIDHPQLES
jgi:hypothetical protein